MAGLVANQVAASCPSDDYLFPVDRVITALDFRIWLERGYPFFLLERGSAPSSVVPLALDDICVTLNGIQWAHGSFEKTVRAN